MADKDKPGRLIRLWQLAKLQLNHPPPRSAGPNLPRFTLGGVEPTKGVAVQPSTSLPTPAKDAARQKLEDQAELRRATFREEEKRSREGQRRAHERDDDAQREKFDRAGINGIQRLAAEQQQAEAHRGEVQQLDEFFQHKSAELENTIAEAFEVGYFSDEWAAAAERSEAREADRGHDDGGRERE